ncbi:MAG: PAS domain S-box protein, partial [Chloroflexi bacterium]
IGNEILGVLDMQSPQLDAFDCSDVATLETLAAQMATAIDNARLYSQSARRNRELTLLNRVIAASAAGQAIEPILEVVCRELACYFDVPQAAAALFDEARTRAVVVAEYRAEGRPSGLGEVIPVAGNPSIQYLLDHKAPLAVDEAQSDPRLAGVHELMRRRGTVSLLLAPLLVNGEVVGSLGLDAVGSRHFGAEEVNLVQRVIEQAGGALTRTRLEETRQLLSTTVEQSSDSVFITDTQGAILYVNPAFERVTGYRSEEVIGRNPRLLKSGKQDEAFYRSLWQIIGTGQVWQGRLVNRKRVGSLYTEDLTITPVRTQEGSIISYVATGRDVTRELELEEQFHQAQKMEALGRLAGGVAHDFGNVLTVINISARLMEKQLRPEDPLWKHLERIQDAGQRAVSLSRQLLSFSRKEITRPQILDLTEVLGDMLKMLQRILGDDIELTTVLPEDLWPVEMDPSQVDQILVNLAVNAQDAMPQGGHLTIETANVVLDEAYAAHRLDVQPGEYVVLSVSDSGIGMNDAVKAHLFEPFFTTKEPGKGTGLGLSTVFGIVKQHGGHIWVYS